LTNFFIEKLELLALMEDFEFWSEKVCEKYGGPNAHLFRRNFFSEI
jgi:hypothetical protein